MIIFGFSRRLSRISGSIVAFLAGETALAAAADWVNESVAPVSTHQQNTVMHGYGLGLVQYDI